MSLDDFPTPETLTSWQERILSGAVDSYRDELQRQEIQGAELGEKVEEFETLAKGLVNEKKSEWSEIIGKNDVEESGDAPEDVETRLAKSLVIIAKEKLEE